MPYAFDLLSEHAMKLELCLEAEEDAQSRQLRERSDGRRQIGGEAVARQVSRSFVLKQCSTGFKGGIAREENVQGAQDWETRVDVIGYRPGEGIRR